jgi:thioredoxin 1
MRLQHVFRIGAVGLVVVAVAVILLVKRTRSEAAPEAPPPGPVAVATAAPDETPPADAPSAIPRLVDLGAGRCIPCKKMAPILVALRREFEGRFDVVFIDVWEDKEAAVPYRIRMIPTQIFYDENGEELFRHEGFFSREDILGAWAKHGYEFEGAGADKGAGSDARMPGAPVHERSEWAGWRPIHPERTAGRSVEPGAVRQASSLSAQPT